jgi:hypothetical protein
LNTEEAQEDAMNPPPVVVGMTLCDYVHVEEGGTRKISLIGTFHALRVAGFPATSSFQAYAVLTDGLGEARITVEIERLATGDRIYTYDRRARFDTKLQLLKVSLSVRDCTFPAPGWYQATLHVDGAALTRYRFRVFGPDEE